MRQLSPARLALSAVSKAHGAEDRTQAQMCHPSLWILRLRSLSPASPLAHMKPTLRANGPVYLSRSVSFSSSRVQNHSVCCPPAYGYDYGSRYLTTRLEEL